MWGMGAIVYRDRLQGVFDALELNRPFQVVLPDGSAATHGQAPYAFTIHIKTGRAARDIVTKSSLGFGEAYTRGEVDVEGDLQDVALLSYELQERLLKGSLLEENVARTVGSIGESVAAGAIFTIPAFVMADLWPALTPDPRTPEYWKSVALMMIGGTLGILFVTLLRRVMVEDPDLPYPE